MRVRAVVAYDGTDYSGFQRQANAPTVQAALEAALAQVTQERITVLAAGRTDTGVHAVGQVIAFDTTWRHGVGALQRALNAVLPPDVAARKVEESALGFHPRYDARSRRYRYTMYNAPVRCPLARRYSLYVTAPLDLGAMQRAAQFLVGEHDFATFGQPPQGQVTVRQALAAEWSGEPPWLTFDIEANAFLYRMVRSIVGTLLQVGRGGMSVDEFSAAMAAHDRSQAGPTAPPRGLCLMEVKY
ncbi:MAG: tRNA pseudouridine(38-40) synthase TruA [Chloroflexota bacterium]|nr:tRNA pseudouridine(38-40) synthase TruA [Chloroflexota bacterium]